VKAMGTLEALTLDLDDTLLDPSDLGAAIEETCVVVAAASGSFSVEKLRLANALVWERLWPEFQMDWTLGRMSGNELTHAVWRQTLSACGADDPELAEMAARTHLGAYQRSLRLYPDARILLDAAAAVALPIALITNGASDTQREKLRALNIEGAFGAVVISGELGVAKPDARVFEVALRAIGTVGRVAWHVGDSLGSDVAGANAAGLTSVWLNRAGHIRPRHAATPAVEIRSLGEIAENFRA